MSSIVEMELSLARDMLYRTLSSPHGIAMRADNAERAADRLREARRLAHDPQLDGIVIRAIPNGLALVKRQPAIKVRQDD